LDRCHLKCGEEWVWPDETERDTCCDTGGFKELDVKNIRLRQLL
jgi:hypothetical protein